MLKYTILFGAIFYMVQSQRPWHAGSGNRLPQVLPQYIDERIATEQAAQEGQMAQGDQILPTGQEAQGISGGQGAPEIPVRQGTQGILVCQCPQGIVVPAYQAAQGSPTYQGAQGIPTYQGNPMGQGAQGSQSTIGNRIDSGDGGFAVATAPLPTTTINPADLPVDAHGDIDLINRIKTWPRDKQPFWYINWQAIQAHRGDVNSTAQPAQTQPNPRSFFAG